MPFIKLSNTHSCKLPKTRDDGDALVIGDEWQCDEEIITFNIGRICAKKYRWHHDQREGEFWMPMIER